MVAGCGVLYGCRFNVEASTNAVPQAGTSVDALRGIVAGQDLVVGGGCDFRGFGSFAKPAYFVSRDSDALPEFEGRLPALPNPFQASSNLVGVGPSTVGADKTRGVVLIADARESGETAAGVGVFRASALRLANASFRPAGVHTEAAALTCWVVRRTVLAVQAALGESVSLSTLHLAVDERTFGVGLGNVYIAAVESIGSTRQRQLRAQARGLSQ